MLDEHQTARGRDAKILISRFNKEELSIDEADDKILVAVFTNRLWKGKFLFSLYKNDLKTMSEVLYRATKYMNAEDTLLAREEKPRKKGEKGRHMARLGMEEGKNRRPKG